MKKSVISVLSIFAFIAFAAFVTTSCGGSSEKSENDSVALNTPDTARIDHEGFAPTTNIRYIDSDSVIRAYEYAKQESARLDQKALELEQYHNTLNSQLQKKATDIQQKLNNNGYLSEQSYQADMNEFQTMQNNAEANYAKRAQALATEMTQVQETILRAVENYVIKYNLDKKYDAILFKNAGVYFNPELDITQDIIDGLNSEVAASSSTEAK